MTENDLNEIKYLVETVVSQSEARIKSEITDINSGLRTEITKLRNEMRDGFKSVADIVEESQDRLDLRIDDH
jgi:hypothetical protein